jgi:hypothetical protein
MIRSFWRQKKCRQNNLTEIIFDVVGLQASGIDKSFIKSVERIARGEFLVTFQEIAFRDVHPIFVRAIQAGRLAHVTAVTEQSCLVELISASVTIVGVESSAVIQDITYEAVNDGEAGDLINIIYVDGATQGNEVVTVNGNSIEVQIEDGVSEATDVKAAIDGDLAAAALVTATITGTAGNAQDAFSPAIFLAGGVDAVVPGDNIDGDFSAGVVWHYDVRAY